MFLRDTLQKGIANNYCKFSSQLEDARIICAKLESVSYFGLLKVMPTKGDTIHFCFLHPFIEEYLAALHLAGQKKEAQLDFIKLCAESNMRQYLHTFGAFILAQ